MTSFQIAAPRTGLLDQALALATRHALARQRADGAWVADPDPRITETALTALALDRSPVQRSRDAARRARVWLRSAVPQDHHPAARTVEEVLRAIALGLDAAEAPVNLDVPALNDPAMASRARLLQTVALTCAPSATGYDPAALRAALGAASSRLERLKSWSRVEVWSAYALVEEAFGEPERARWAVKHVAALQSADGGFHGNPVTAAIACLALLTVDPGSRAARRVVGYLVESQFPDGTWRFCSSDVWDTTLMVRALRDEPAFARDALPAAVAFIRRAQNEDGGWPFRSGVESDNDTTGAALLALRGLDAGDASVGAGLRHLAEQQQPDGLWRTWQSAGDPAVQDVNAHVLAALDAHRDGHGIATKPARDWLRDGFEQGGRWHGSWYRGLPYVVAEVAPAMAGHGVARAAAEGLAAIQNPDGGWPAESGLASNPACTGLALAALEAGGVRDPGRWRRGLDYLVATQDPDGAWPGIPQMFGPRPLLTHYQSHTQAFAALGLCAGLRVQGG